MAISLTLNEIASGYNLSKINENFDLIGEALDDALSRSGTLPNQMEADLDLNNHSLLNVDSLEVESLIIGGTTLVVDALIAVGPAGDDATVTVGTVTTGAAGSSVVVTNVGTVNDAILDFTIPRGNTGASGAGTGDMVAAQNLADVVSAATSFTNIKQVATASDTGVVELATDAETITGTSTSLVVTPANLEAKLDGQSGYRFLARRTFTVSGSYTPTTGTTLMHVIMCGGGGGGGGADAPSGVQAAGGGSGAETCDFIMLIGAVTTPVTINIGAGGNGGLTSGGNGSNGVDTTFGSYATAKRGLGGDGASGSGWGASGGALRSSAGIVPSGGLRFAGADGTDGIRGDGGSGSLAIRCTAGNGGGSFFGGGGNGSTVATIDAAGRDGGNYGSGGGGGAASTSSGATGGDGADGVVIIYEYTSGA